MQGLPVRTMYTQRLSLIISTNVYMHLLLFPLTIKYFIPINLGGL